MKIWSRGAVAAAVAWGALGLSGGAGAATVEEMQLHAAARECRPAEVRQWLDRGVNIESRASGGYTALIYAADSGCEEAVRLLLERGADRSAKSDSGWDAAYLAKLNNHPRVMAMLAGGAATRPTPARPRPAPAPVVAGPGGRQPATPAAPAGGLTARGWPKLGHYRVGQRVLYSGTAGKTWQAATIKSIDPTYGYNFPEVSGSTDAYFVVGTNREPFWTQWFVGDWKVSVPMAMNTMTDGRYVYRVVSGGMRLPPLRISADGTYAWRYQGIGKGERLIRGRWEPNPAGPGVILKSAAEGADWLVYNNSRTGSQLGETVILSSDCCTYMDGSRLGR